MSISVYGVGTERFDAAPGDAGKYEDDITGPYCTKDLLPVEISPPMDDIPGLKVSTVTLYCDHDHEDLDT